MNTNKLNQFALFLRDDARKITDALFVESLVDEIRKRNADKETVTTWLTAHLVPVDKKFDDYNCIEVYNISFYHSLLENLS